VKKVERQSASAYFTWDITLALCNARNPGAQPGGWAFGAFAPTPKILKYCIAILTFAETFK